MRTILLAVLATAVTSVGGPITTKGTVVVRSHQNYVAIAVAPAGGGQLERLFVFWPVDPVMGGVKRLENAMVEYEGGRLRITQSDEKVALIYYVDELVPPGFRRAPDGFSSTGRRGKGLSHYVGGAASTMGISGSAKADEKLCYIDITACESNVFTIGE